MSSPCTSKKSLSLCRPWLIQTMNSVKWKNPSRNINFSLWQRLMSFFFKNYTSMSQFLFVYIVRQKRKKKFADFIKKNLGFLKFSKIEVCYRQILKIRSSINLPWSHDLFSRFLLLLLDTNKQTPRHLSKVYI